MDATSNGSSEKGNLVGPVRLVIIGCGQRGKVFTGLFDPYPTSLMIIRITLNTLFVLRRNVR